MVAIGDGGVTSGWLSSRSTAWKRHDDKMDRLVQAQHNKTSVHTSSYEFSEHSTASASGDASCPPNQFYNHLRYESEEGGVPLSSRSLGAQYQQQRQPRDLIDLQDGWSRSLAHAQYNLRYEYTSPDLRDNIQAGKRIIKNSPLNAAAYNAKHAFANSKPFKLK